MRCRVFLAIIGAPVGTRQDILHWIAVVRREVADVGRKLAAKYDFAYPDALENTVRQSWHAFIYRLTADANQPPPKAPYEVKSVEQR